MAWSARIAKLRGYPVIAAAFALWVAGCAGTDSVEDRQRSDTRAELAKDYLHQGELRPARSEAERALEHDAENEEAHNILGLVSYLRALSNFELLEIESCLTGVDAEALRSEMDEHLLEAEEHFRRAVRIDERFGEAWSNWGTVALRLGKYREAVHHLDEALAHPARLRDPAVTRANLGWAHFELDAYVEAAKELRQARQFRPEMCLANYRLGRVYFARDEWENARETLGEVIADDCPIQEAHLYYMKAGAELGDAEDRGETAGACVALAPESCIAARCRAIAP